jgi:hypothetical protein
MMARGTTAREERERAATKDMSTGVIRAAAMMGREMERATKVGFSEKL